MGINGGGRFARLQKNKKSYKKGKKLAVRSGLGSRSRLRAVAVEELGMRTVLGSNLTEGGGGATLHRHCSH